MSAPLAALEDALTEEIRLERELAAAGGRKRDALVALDAAGVDQATSREQNLLVALAAAAERRLRRTAEAARLFAVPEAEISVTRIAAAAGEPVRARLLALAGGLREALKEVFRVNVANRALTEQSLDHVKRFFRILGGAREPGVYSRRGFPQARPENPKVMFDEVV